MSLYNNMENKKRKFVIPWIPESKKNNYAVWYNKQTKKATMFKGEKWTKYERRFKYLLRNFIKEKYFFDKKIYPLNNLKGIVMVFYFNNKHRKDLFNIAQFIDLFVDLKILEDDNWVNTGDVILKPKYNKDQEEKTEVIFFLGNKKSN